MGMKYASADSAALMSALSANVSTARSTLDSTIAACDQLAGALGGGRLSGKAYASAKEMFTGAIKPGLADLQQSVTEVESDLTAYTQADGLVSQYGDLDEDQLREQLRSVRSQQDLTEQEIQTHRMLAASTLPLPGAALSHEMTASRLETVYAGLEDDARELEDKLRALDAFNSQTSGLFGTWLEGMVDFVGGVSDAGGDLPGVGQYVAGIVQAKQAIGAGKWSTNKRGHILLNGKTVYRPKTDHLTKLGKHVNAVGGVRIDHYGKPLKAGMRGLRDATVGLGDDFKGWKGASSAAKWGKGLGAAGTLLTVGSNAHDYFHDGVQGSDVRDFVVDTTVDVGSAAAAAGIGAAAGSFFLPPLGTVVGAGVGLVFNFAMNSKVAAWGDKSLTDVMKDGIKKGFDWVQSKFW